MFKECRRKNEAMVENMMMNRAASIRNESMKDIEGKVFLPSDKGYESARKVWNAMIDRHPALIVRCNTTADVVREVKFARDNGLLLAVRGGGHHIAGHAVCDDGMVIDLSEMKAVRVDANSRLAAVEGGAVLADLDAATQAYGLATPVGINSTTGIAGLTLGGGFGWLSRKYGMTIDNLEAAEIVTAAGEVVLASDIESPDLFWAIRGGSGNFGIVTRFVFRLHPVGPGVMCGLIAFGFSEAKSVLRQYRDFMKDAPDALSVWALMRKAPPLPFIDEGMRGREIIALALCYADDPETGKALIAPLRAFGKPVGEHIGIQPYAAWQKAFDPLLTAGARNYWKSHNLTNLEDGLFDTVIASVQKLPSSQSEIFFGALGCAASRPAPDAAAYAHRDAQYVMNIHGRWDHWNDDEVCIRWARDVFTAAAPYASGGVYVNFLTADEEERVRSAYGPNFDRLVQLKRKYDPDNLFRMNQNIMP